MRKLLNNPLVVAMLALAAAVFVGKSLYDQRRPVVRASVATQEELPTAESAEEFPGADAAVASLADALKGLGLPDQLPDPFAARRARTEEAEGVGERLPDITETLHLAAIWQQENERLAFINGRIAHAGETIGRITLETFERDGIWLTHWKGRDFLRLGQDFTLITPAANAAALETAEDER